MSSAFRSSSRSWLTFALLLTCAGPWLCASAPLSGRVLDEAGRPLPEVRVTLVRVGGVYHESVKQYLGRVEPEVVFEALTDRRGLYRVPAQPQGVYELVAEQPGRLPMQSGPRAFVAGTWLEDLVMMEAEVRSVPVLSRDAPIANTLVRISGPPQKAWHGSWSPIRWRPRRYLVRADANGEVHYPALGVWPASLAAWAPGYSHSLSLVNEEDFLWRISLAGDEQLTLTVLDPQGNPAPDVVVRRNGFATALSDVQGKAVLHYSGHESKVRFTLAALDGSSFAGILDPRSYPERLKLHPVRPVEVQLVGAESGEALPGVTLWIPGQGATAVSDSEGRCRLEVAPLARAIYADGPGIRRNFYRAPWKRLESGELTWPLTRQEILSGQVVGDGDQPLDGARVQVQSYNRHSGGLWRDRMDLASVWTNVDGRFQVELRSRAPEYEIRATADGYAPAILRQTELQARLKLERGLSVSGRVLGPEGQHLSGVLITALPKVDGKMPKGIIESGQPWSPHQVRSDAQGRFAIAQLPPRQHVVSVQSPRMEWASATSRPFTLTSGQEPFHLEDIQLKPSISLAGRVQDSQGKALEDVEIISDATGYLPGIVWDQSSSWPGLGRSVRTDAQGRFELTGLAPGWAGLQFTKAGYASESSHYGLPHHSDLTVTLERGIRLRASLTDASGQPLSQAQIYLSYRTISSSKQRHVPLDGGRIEAHDLPPGDYQLVVQPRQGPSEVIELGRLEEGSDYRFPIGLGSESVQLSGRVVDAEGEPAGPSSIRLSSLHGSVDGRNQVSWRSDGDLNGFRMTLPRPGRYEAVVTAAGYGAARKGNHAHPRTQRDRSAARSPSVADHRDR